MFDRVIFYLVEINILCIIAIGRIPIPAYADLLLIYRTRLAMRAIVNAASEVSLFLYPFATDGARVMLGVLRLDRAVIA